jgi:type VI secretion system protein ImpK
MDPHRTTTPASDELLDLALRQLYEEVELIRQQWPEGGEAPASEVAEAAARQAQQRLCQLIERQDPLGRRGAARTSAALLEPARYLKAALADELLLTRAWAGREAWPRYLLETALYRSSVAGDRVLDGIERLLSEREPALRPLARQYLSALALGFQGRWRGQPEAAGLPGLRRELYQFAYQRQPEGGDFAQRLAPQAYAHTLSHLAPRRQRRLSRWMVGGLLGGLSLLLLSELLWLWPTWSLRQALVGPVAAPLDRSPEQRPPLARPEVPR